MKRTLTINLNGIVFHIDEDAFGTLSTYLSEIEAHFTEEERKEIMNDIEARIGELLSEKINAHKKVINIEDIDSIIAILGMPNQFCDEDENSEKHTSTEQSAKQNKQERKKNRKYYRDTDHQMLGGVLSGLAAYIKWDANLLRILFLIISVFGFGWIIAVYFIVWIVTPEAKTVAQKLEMSGEEPSLDNIKTYLESEQFKDSIEQVGSTFVRIFTPILKGISIIFGVIIAMAGIAIVGIIIALTIISISTHSTGELLETFGSSNFMYLQYPLSQSFMVYTLIVSILLIIIIPVISLIIGAINLSLINNNKQSIKIHSSLKWISGIAWLLSIILSIGIVIHIATATRFQVDEYNDTMSMIRSYNDDFSKFEASDAKRFKVGDFSRLEVGNAIAVTIVEADSNHILVDAPKHILEDFTYKVDDNSLMLYYDKPLNFQPLNNTVINVMIYRTSLDFIEADAASKIYSEGQILSENITIDADAASSIDIDVKAKIIECNANAASKIKIKADCDIISGDANAASYIIFDGKAKNMRCDASAASKIDLTVTCDTLLLDANAASRIVAEGKCDAIDVNANTTSECDLTDFIATYADASAYGMSKIMIKAKYMTLSATGMSKVLYSSVDGSALFDNFSMRFDETSTVENNEW